MKFVDEFRDPQAARRLVEEIRRTATRTWVIMEVCGGQTHSLLRHGIEQELQGAVELVHGPGCPVCVTPAEDIDRAVELSRREDVLVASFGDMLRVPGSRQSLLDARAEGAHVRIIYSPLDAVALAQKEPDRHVVLFAVGFETTAPATALAVLQARELGLENFSLLVSHVCVQPAMEALMEAPGHRIDGFLAAGHVCAVTGYESYSAFAERFRVPVVVTGFEPIDLLEGIRDCVAQLESGRSEVTNQYARCVREDGNAIARETLRRVYQIDDTPWRGLGTIPAGGMRLRPEFGQFDARLRFPSVPAPRELALRQTPPCPAGEVLSGRLRPRDCPQFATACTPDSPLGAPMVSAEGACAAYFRYEGQMPASAESSNRQPHVGSGSRS